MRGRSIVLAAAALVTVAAAPASARGASPAPVTPPERALYSDGPSGRHLLEHGWSTRADPADSGIRRGWQRPGAGAGFRAVSVPHAFNAGDTSAAGNRSRVQWYRIRFRAPATGGAAEWRLRFESVNVRARAWLNGRPIGGHEGAHLPFELRAAGLRRGRLNELVVRVDGRASRTDLPPAGRERGWWNHGGLLREVYLRRVGRVDAEDVDVRTGVGDPARVRVSATLRNVTRRSLVARITAAELLPPGGAAAGELRAPLRAVRLRPGQGRRVSADFRVPEARLWSPEQPSLYTARLAVTGGQRLTAHAGIREWSRDGAGRVLLNGRPLSLRGASFHEETPESGAALKPDELTGIAAALDALGADFTRQHYPAHPALLEEFDRRGIVFWQQVPVWRLRRSQLGARALRPEALARLRRMVLRDRTHPSVLAWSIGNELLRGGAPEAVYVREARRLVRRLDPTRLVTIDKSLSPLSQVPAVYRELDALGVSEYLGWYGDSRTEELRPSLDRLRARFPRLPLFVTEFGAEASREGPATEKGTFAFQADFLERHLAVLDATPYLNGAIVWLLRDYLVRPGWSGGNPQPTPPFSRKGLLQLDGTPKPAFEAVRRRFAGRPSTAAP